MRTPTLIILFYLYSLRFPQIHAFALNPFQTSSENKGEIFFSSVQDPVKHNVKGHSAGTSSDGIQQAFFSHKMNENNHADVGNKGNDTFIEPKSLRFREGAAHCKRSDIPGMLIVNCSNLKLDAVPQGLPRTVNMLILNNNNLNSNSLASAPFRRYSQLTHLFLESNNISFLPDRAFIGLDNLEVLSLQNNSIIMNKALNQSEAFIPLKRSLYELVFNNNTKDVNAPGLMYPDKTMSYLSNLHILHMDGLPNTIFGYHFQFIKYVTKLSLEGYYTGKCNLSLFQNDTFKYLPTIQHLIISDCKLYKDFIENKVLEPLTELEHLEVSYNFHLGLDGLGKLMNGQRNNKNLKKITMKYIVQRYEPCIVLYKETLKNFRNLSLEAVDANHNNIEMIAQDAIEYLPKTLKRVNMTRNNIMFGAYWRQMKYMISLESLDLDGFDQGSRIPSQLPPENIHCQSHSGEQEVHRSINRSTETDGALNLQLPPNLKNLTMRSYSMSYKIDAMAFDPRNKLNMVDLHGNYLPVLSGPISGLHSLEHLDLSSCSVREISGKFFGNLTSLKTVNLYSNLLGESLAKKSTTFYSDSLEDLNLGANNIFELNNGMFKNCFKLSTLILSDNRIRVIDSALDNLPKLSRLFLTQNDLSTLPKTLRDHFDGMKGRVFVDMTFNPIYCDCENIDFLEWVVHTKIFGNNYTDYYCVYPHKNYKRERMGHGYDEELKILIKQCANNTQLLMCVISATVAVFFVLIGVIIFRFRWTMRYWCHVAKYMLSNKSNDTNKEEFEYDLFVCYCHQDNNFVTEELEPRLGQERDIKLLLQDNCFHAGHEKAENILMAVRQSRKTLVVMSRPMLDSALCNYSLQMARQESISTGRTVLVILFLEKIPKATMSLDMINYIKSNVIVTYPADDPNLQREFWDRLAHDLELC